jgi:predicted GIY-YIG superfamily endonuclease
MANDKGFWYLYLLRCWDGSIYTGITNDVEARVREHNQGSGAEYTAQRRPVILIYQEQHPDQNSARRREEQIKRWGRKRRRI